MENFLLSIFERVVAILTFGAIAIMISCKKKSKKIPVHIVGPIYLLFLVFIILKVGFGQHSFASLDKAVQSYSYKAEIIATLEDEKTTYVVMEKEGEIEGEIFPKSGKKWKLPDSAFIRRSMEIPTKDANIYMSAIGKNESWYIVILPHYVLGDYFIGNVEDSVGTKFFEAKSKDNVTVYYGYLKTKPDDYWISVDGDKVDTEMKINEDE